ncbi:MAG: ABC transporter ATP-binding protein [Nitrososphaerales archaeon]
MNQFASRLVSVTKTYDDGPNQITAVDKATFSVSPGETVGIVGPSGSGKTTLLNLMGSLQTPTSGDVFFQERNLKELSAVERRRLRLTKIGFVFQQLRLIPTLSVVENVELPMILSATPANQRKKKAQELVESVGLAGKENRRPSQLSVGEQQRVAVARALANSPILVLADEPTSQLDSSSGLEIVELLDALSKNLDATVVISTHDPKMCEDLGHIYRIRDGVLTAGIT